MRVNKETYCDTKKHIMISRVFGVMILCLLDLTEHNDGFRERTKFTFGFRVHNDFLATISVI